MTASESTKVARLIHKEIKGTAQGVGHPLPSERVMADKYGCSRTTVRSALGQLERQGLLNRVQGKGTFLINMPGDAPAPIFDRSQLTQVGLLVINSEEMVGVYAILAAGLREVLISNSHQVNFWSLNTRDGVDAESFPPLLDMSDLFVVTGDFGHAEIAWLAKMRKPMIVIGQAGDEVLRGTKIPYLQVYHDQRAAYMQATEYLLSTGYRQPAILTASGHQAFKNRYEGFIAALRNRGIEPKKCMHFVIDPTETHGDVASEKRYAGIERVFESRDRFDALITGMYTEVIGAAWRGGISIPGDFALIAETCRREPFLEEFKITEMRADHHEIGRFAAQRILQQKSYDAAHQGRLSLPIELIMRESCPPR